MSGKINDWHNLRNDCPQNSPDTIEQDCTCEAPFKRHRACSEINRACVKQRLLQEANSRQAIREFTQVSKRTLDEIHALVKREILKRAEDPPRKGRTL